MVEFLKSGSRTSLTLPLIFKTMKSVFILYSCNLSCSPSEKVILGVFTTKVKAVAYARRYASKSEYGKLDPDDIRSLYTNDCTYNRDENFMIEHWDVDSNKIYL